MNPSSLLALLQVAASLLVAAQNPAAPSSTMQGAINFAGNAVQMAVQETAPINFAVPQNDGAAPNINDLLNAPYLDGNGSYVPLGSTVSLIEQYTSFGDLNADGVDDATVVINRPSATGEPNYFLAVMLNQGGIMFNIADLPLGSSVDINSHSITDGKIVIDGSQYMLLGNQLVKI